MVEPVRVGDPPAGTVSFLFTDIEGSTRLLDELGTERFADLLAEHHRVCRSAWAAHGGFEVRDAGDGFFVAFPTAAGALAAAADAQAALAPLDVRVRMGIHTGEVLVADTGYVGIEVHRAARIADAAHGGQVVVSAATAARAGLGLHDLGDHRFKDLREPERVFQLGDGVFPPLRSLHRSNLPVPATAFLGRVDELADLRGLLTRPDVRHVTLTGPGGTGKTRLGLQAAADASDAFAGGVYWASLAPLRDPGLVLAGVASALEVTEPADGELLAAIALRVGGRPTLVLLDNAEHLLPRVADAVAALLDACARLTVLVTSRERLHLRGEHVYPVPALGEDDATELFVARARQLDPGFAVSPAVPELCRLLDDLPLALELAAARSAVFTPDQLLARIGQRLDLRGERDADPRQQTLRATIDWSHGLLADDERRLFRRLCVFPAGCTFEEAEEVADATADVLQSLLDKSLVRRRATEPEPQYWQLETIREYAEERLRNAGEDEQINHRLVDTYLAFAHSAELGWHRGDIDYWGDRFVGELPNIRAALEWSLPRRPEAALAIAAYLGYCWQITGLFPEMLDWIERAQLLTDNVDPDVSTYAMMVGGIGREETGRPGAEALFRASLPRLLEQGRLEYHAFMLVYVAGYEARRDAAAAEGLLRQAEREALEVETDNYVVLGAALKELADLAEARGDDDEALSLLERAAGLEVIHPSHKISTALGVAEHLLGRGDPDRAEPWLARAAALAEEFPLTARFDQPPLETALAVAALLRGDADAAERHIARAREASELAGRSPMVAKTFLVEAALHALRGDVDAARTLQQRAFELLPGWTPSGGFRAVSRLLLETDEAIEQGSR
jgi:predicted ATPase/class 3 adenylate cyclase